jgi:hypothetical protein
MLRSNMAIAAGASSIKERSCAFACLRAAMSRRINVKGWVPGQVPGAGAPGGAAGVLYGSTPVTGGRDCTGGHRNPPAYIAYVRLDRECICLRQPLELLMEPSS